MVHEDGSQIGIHHDVQLLPKEAGHVPQSEILQTQENYLIDILAGSKEVLTVEALAETAKMTKEQVGELLEMSSLSQQLVVLPEESRLLYRLKRRKDMTQWERREANENIIQIASLIRDHPHVTVDLLQQETSLQRYKVYNSVHELAGNGWIVQHDHENTRTWTYRDLWQEVIEPQLMSQRGKLYTFVRKRIQDRDQVDEIVQQVCFDTFYYRYSLNPHMNVESWLFELTNRTVYDAMQHKSPIPFSEVERRFFDPEYEDPYAETILYRGEAPEEIVLHWEAIAILLNRLPENLKKAVLLRYYYELSNVAVGKVMQKSEKTVRTYLKQAGTIMKQAWIANYGAIPEEWRRSEVRPRAKTPETARKEAKAQALFYDEHMTKEEVCKTLNISRAAFYRYVHIKNTKRK